MFIRFVTIIMLTMSVAFACKGQGFIDRGFSTTHLLSPSEWNLNEDNYFVGVGYNCFFYGEFINSYHNESFIVGYQFDINRWLNINVGVINGYVRENLMDFMFIGDTEWVWVIAPEVNLPITDSLTISGRLFGEVLQTSIKYRF